MPETQDCSVTFCESFAKCPRELHESWGWDLKGGALFSLNYVTFILTLSLSLSLLFSQSFTSPYQSLSVSLFLTPHLSLSLTLSLLLSVCLYLSFSLFLFLLLNELVIRIMHGDGSSKVSRKFFSREVGHFGNKEFRTTPICIYIYMYMALGQNVGVWIMPGFAIRSIPPAPYRDPYPG